MAVGSKVGEAYVELHYRLDQLARDFKVAQGTVGAQVESLKREVDTRSQGMFGGVNDALDGINSKLGVVGKLAVVAFAVEGAKAVGRFVTQVAEAGTKVQLLQAKLAGTTGNQQAFDLAIASANKLGISVETVAETMQRFGLAGRDIGLTTGEVQKLTEVVIQLGRISGSSNGELSAGMYQLSQSLAAGKLNGDELRSVMENIPEVARTIAASLGVGVGELRKMGEEGQLTADVVSKALLGSADSVAERFGKLPETLEQSQARWETAWTMLMAALDDKFHASDFFKFVTSGASSFVERLTVGLGGGDSGAQDRVLSDQIDALRSQRGLAGMRSPGGAADIDRQIDALQTQLGELRLSQFQAVEPAPFVDPATGKSTAAPTRKETLQARADLDASIKLKQEIAERQQEITQQALKDDLDAFEDNERKKTAAATKAASDAKAAAERAKSDTTALIKETMTAADTYAATVERLKGYLAKGQISQDDFNKAVAGAKVVLDEANDAAARKEKADKDREAEASRRAAREALRARERLDRDREEQQEAVDKRLAKWKDEDPRAYFTATEDPELARIYDLQSGVSGAFKDMSDDAMEFGRIAGDAISTAADIGSAAIASWAMGAEVDINRVAEALSQQVIQEFIAMMIRGGIGALGTSLFGPGQTGGGTITASHTGSGGGSSTWTGPYADYAGARGLVFGPGGVTPMRTGGVVDSARIVPMRRGAALIGEAGPEGVLPLRRNSKGELGVMAGGGGGGSGAQRSGDGATFIMNDHRGAGAPPIETRQRRGQNGALVIEATVRDTTRKQVTRGDHDAAFSERFGVRPTPVR